MAHQDSCQHPVHEARFRPSDTPWEGTGVVRKSPETLDARGSRGQDSGRRFRKSLKRRP